MGQISRVSSYRSATDTSVYGTTRFVSWPHWLETRVSHLPKDEYSSDQLVAPLIIHRPHILVKISQPREDSYSKSNFGAARETPTSWTFWKLRHSPVTAMDHAEAIYLVVPQLSERISFESNNSNVGLVHSSVRMFARGFDRWCWCLHATLFCASHDGPVVVRTKLWGTRVYWFVISFELGIIRWSWARNKEPAFHLDHY